MVRNFIIGKKFKPMNNIEKEIFRIFRDRSDNLRIGCIEDDIASKKFINENRICIEENLIQALIEKDISEKNVKRTISFMVEKGLLIKDNYVINYGNSFGPYIYSIAFKDFKDCQDPRCKRILILTENGKELFKSYLK